MLSNLAGETQGTMLLTLLRQLLTTTKLYTSDANRHRSIAHVGATLLEMAKAAAPGSDNQLLFTRFATFYAETFPDSRVNAVHLAPGDYPSGKQGDVLTVEFKLNLLNPAQGDWLEAIGRVVRVGSKICATQMELRNDSGELIATGNAVFHY